MMYTIFVQKPGIDEDYCWENDYNYFSRRSEAEQMAKELEENFKDSEWEGYKYYRDKFYVGEISETYIENKQHQWALWMASTV